MRLFFTLPTALTYRRIFGKQAETFGYIDFED